MVNFNRQMSVKHLLNLFIQYQAEQLSNEIRRRYSIDISLHIQRFVKELDFKIPAIDIVPGREITKDYRQLMFGSVSGGSGSGKPEKYQRELTERFTGIKCRSTHTRINLRTHTLEEVINPNIKSNGFDYSEDFDGLQTIYEKRIWVNFKCIVGKGGAQTRSLREVYWFVEGQLDVLNNVKENVYFANILDGDEAASCFPKFQYLMSLHSTEKTNRIYVGDLKGYISWFQERFD